MKICRECKGQYTNPHPNSEYCSNKCARKAQNQRYNRKKPVKLVCDCGRKSIASKTVRIYSRQYQIPLCLACLYIEMDFAPEQIHIYKSATGQLYEYT